MATELIRGLYNIAPRHRENVVTIGNFDGVHIGHQALLKKTVAKARELNVPSLVITFEPQPFEFFAPERPVPRLTRWREKFCLLSDHGVDRVLVIPFNAAFAEWSAEFFINEFLVNTLGVKCVIVGDDFRFGRGREGGFAFLSSAGAQKGFEVESMPSILLDTVRVSSTRVRKALLDADHPLAERLLGRPYSMRGRVVHGDKRGRELGFPTANIHLHRTLSPVQGVYSVRMHGIDPTKSLPGVANVGTRPTVGGTRSLLEVHLFDFNQDIYGRQVEVEFCEKQRDEVRYPNLKLLQEQMQNDAEIARHYFKTHEELE